MVTCCGVSVIAFIVERFDTNVDLSFRFYVGCDLCNNWFHGDCVGITEEMAKSLSEFVCSECTHARESQELYCLCRQPYDESQLVIFESYRKSYIALQAKMPF